MLTKLVSILLYTPMSSHYAVHLKLSQCQLYLSKTRKKKWLKWSILYYVYFTMILKSGGQGEKRLPSGVPPPPPFGLSPNWRWKAPVGSPPASTQNLPCPPLPQSKSQSPHCGLKVPCDLAQGHLLTPSPHWPPHRSPI